MFTVITENEVDATPEGPVQVDVTAFQWGWQFYYPATGKVVEGETTEAPQMVVPAGQTIDDQPRDAPTSSTASTSRSSTSAAYAQPGTVNHFNFNVLHDGRLPRPVHAALRALPLAHVLQREGGAPAQFAAWVHQT